MRIQTVKATLNATLRVAALFLLAAAAAFGQQVVNLTAAPTSVTLPDGSTVPMWGYSCGTLVTGSTATCALLNPLAAGNPAATPPIPASWSPIVITVPYVTAGTSLTINLTNSLPASVPETSLVIVGQLGGGLGTTATSAASPAHGAQDVTWPTAATGPQNVPPPQGNRVRSFSTPATHTTAASLTWSNLKPGTYLIESGTYPSIQGPMGLYGILVVTAGPGSGVAGATSTAGCAYGFTTTGGTATCAVPYGT